MARHWKNSNLLGHSKNVIVNHMSNGNMELIIHIFGIVVKVERNIFVNKFIEHSCLTNFILHNKAESDSK